MATKVWNIYSHSQSEHELMGIDDLIWSSLPVLVLFLNILEWAKSFSYAAKTKKKTKEGICLLLFRVNYFVLSFFYSNLLVFRVQKATQWLQTSGN